MTLDELRRVIFGSEPSDWHVIHCWGATSGPSYLDDFGEAAVNGARIEVRAHPERATYRPDVRIGLAWGLTVDERREFDWSQHFSDKRCSPVLADLLWNGSLVDRYSGASVDGGRGVLPMPLGASVETSPTDVEQIGWKVTEAEVSLWCLIDRLKGGESEFDMYLRLAGFTVVRGEER
jgi:hypothetical protein